ncbi:MarC family protein [Inmirania thermothiophila]|uniref:UPF0056 membrane protein n=1 Tax=Inmirania thermothiophila TaxID=1750597 RepID=A0A3N1XXU1_9GAMM|nr:MarC family protein [Inmirania thermothiophila]ROR29747.1 multiple antibiotic resistance protein [Inmirania thermothiophila]
MLEALAHYGHFLVTLLAVMDPFAAVPVFLALTERQTAPQRRRTAGVTAATVLAVLGLSAVFGEAVLRAMGASLASFRIGGGIILLMMALEMLRARPSQVQQTPEEIAEAGAREQVAVVPLGVPLLAGPGAISAVIIEAHREAGLGHRAAVLLAVALAALLLWATLRLAAPIGARLGHIGISIANRLVGLVLAAIAVEILVGGLRETFPVLAGG